MRRRLPVAAAALILVMAAGRGRPCRAAEETAASDAPLTWTQVGADARYVFTRPAHLDRSGWIKVACAFGVGAALYLVRDDIREFARNRENDGVTRVLDDARTMGKVSTPLLASAGFYLAGVARHSDYDKETSVLLLENLGYASVITGVAQRILATERPRDGDDVTWFGSGGGHSVSGDVTVAASLLAPIIDRHLLVEPDDGRGIRFWKRFGAVALYGTAGLVALQRINTDAHWAPDVYFGYLNGLCVGRLLVDSRHGGREWRDARRARRVEFTPTASGFRIAWR